MKVKLKLKNIYRGIVSTIIGLGILYALYVSITTTDYAQATMVTIIGQLLIFAAGVSLIFSRDTLIEALRKFITRKLNKLGDEDEQELPPQ